MMANRWVQNLHTDLMPVKEICIKPFTETCFLWIIDPQETIPIKVNRWTKGITNFLLIYSDPPQVKQSQLTVGSVVQVFL